MIIMKWEKCDNGYFFNNCIITWYYFYFIYCSTDELFKTWVRYNQTKITENTLNFRIGTNPGISFIKTIS